MKKAPIWGLGKVISINVRAPIVTQNFSERPSQQNNRRAYLKCCAAWRKSDDCLRLCIHRARLAAYTPVGVPL